jgi:hypothetical protein
MYVDKRVNLVFRWVRAHALFIVRFALRCGQSTEMFTVRTWREVNFSAWNLLFFDAGLASCKCRQCKAKEKEGDEFELMRGLTRWPIGASRPDLRRRRADGWELRRGPAPGQDAHHYFLPHCQVNRLITCTTICLWLVAASGGALPDA